MVLDRAYGSLVGSAIGDAMGMPASFMSPSQIRQEYGRITDFVKPTKEQMAHSDFHDGQITDDTEKSLIIASVLTEAKVFDLELYLKKMRNWAIENKMLETTVIGPSTRRFLEVLIDEGDLSDVGKTGDTNGGAMSVMPIGIFHHRDKEKAIEDALSSAKPSHGSQPGLAATCAISSAVSLAVHGGYTIEEIIDASIYGAQIGEKFGYDIPAPSVVARIQLAVDIVERNGDKEFEKICYELYRYLGASMKSYESIPFSLGVFYAAKGNVEKGIIGAVNIGDDADTNASIVGGLCGAFSGANTINPYWVDKVQKENNIDFKRIAKTLVRF